MSYLEVNYLSYQGLRLAGSAWCSIPFTEESVASLYMMLLSTVVYFITPLLCVIFLYVRSPAQPSHYISHSYLKFLENIYKSF